MQNIFLPPTAPRPLFLRCSHLRGRILLGSLSLTDQTWLPFSTSVSVPAIEGAFLSSGWMSSRHLFSKFENPAGDTTPPPKCPRFLFLVSNFSPPACVPVPVVTINVHSFRFRALLFGLSRAHTLFPR